MRIYNVTVNYSRYILNSTHRHPVIWNDMKILIHDDLIRGTYENERFYNYIFELLEYNNIRNARSVQYKGVCFISDNSYLNWLYIHTLIPISFIVDS